MQSRKALLTLGRSDAEAQEFAGKQGQGPGKKHSWRVELEREHWQTVLTTQLSVILHVNGEVCLENRHDPIEAKTF